jgi:uncharacterized heparinase superfamily protein
MAKAMRKPPHVVADRILAEAKLRWEAYTVPRSGSSLRFDDVLRDAGVRDIATLMDRIRSRPFVAAWENLSSADLDVLVPGEVARLRARADAALRNEVDLLGSGPTRLGETIDWHRDHKSGRRWDAKFYGAIRYGDPKGGSDVKVPWEISRLHWLMPAAQMYLLTRDERYAAHVRSVIDHWIAENPYGGSVNWTCTMEVALRILSWTFFDRALAGSTAWDDHAFQERFLLSLYEHGHFTDGHLEFSDINGNHYTADAAGLVFAGLYFGGHRRSSRWADRGWRILETELPRQVSSDGADFEASVAYHRLVFELFFLPTLYRVRQHLPVAPEYRERVTNMARFTAAYTQPDGLVPLVGDADDARAMPFGTQPLNDHRYLIGWVHGIWGEADLAPTTADSRAESAWLLGARAASALPVREHGTTPSTALVEAGYYVMRGSGHHVFIDCAPVGLAGRGGHGHNDCLAYTASLDGTPLIVDSGAFVYTLSYADRNHFRSTGVHNTPQLDGEEINRFISPLHLWNMHYDAIPEVREWRASDDVDVFVGSHQGYRRLTAPVTPVRSIVLDKTLGALLVSDAFEGSGAHQVSIPLHLHPGVKVRIEGSSIELTAEGKRFGLVFRGAGWTVSLELARYSPSYGVEIPTSRLVWRATSIAHPLTMIVGGTMAAADIDRRAKALLAEARLDLARWTLNG